MVDSTASLRRVFETVHNDAVELTVCRYNGPQIARLTHSMQTPLLAFARSARSMRSAAAVDTFTY
eukprot:2705313-Lingulodinium_polyedra.AAC.1